MRYAMFLSLASLGAGQTLHHLKASAKTVVVGYYDAAAPPALRVKSGDIVEIETLGVNTPQALRRVGIKDEQMQPALLEVAAANPDKRGHFLTGPIFIEGAEPGDVLEVQIRKVTLAQPYAVNGMGQNGVLADQFPQGGSRLIPLDARRSVARFSDGIEVPLRPFFGSMGVAPPPSAGRISSTPPGIHAGNLDNRELVAGTTLFIPVHVEGALFEVGDGHARQGDGEVDQTGLETSLTGEFRFVVRKDMKLKWPRAETPTHWIVMGLDPDLNRAVRLAVEEAADFLTARGLSRSDAYMLTSVALDLHITQLVDVTKGVHAMIP
ncbi:MAG TPA: acetamidase/formamidase family protein, partial [Myxococcaceae bacterium]|nr:acetamidase/formamidase family protein [Myxococcaceae bacterium]